MTKLNHMLLILLPAVVLTACDWTSQADSDLPDYRHKVAVQPVRLQDNYEVERQFSGQVESTQNPTVAFELPGTIAELSFNEGDEAAAGEVLARLDTQLLQAERQELDARAAEIGTELALARRNLARIERLQQEQMASEREGDELSSRVQQLAASLQRNQAALDGNRIRLEKSELRAPFDALIQRRLADEGTVVDAGAAVFSLVQTGLREVRAGLPVHLFNNLSVGDRLVIRAGDQETIGELIAIGAVVDQSTRSRVVRVRVNADWAPGELAYVSVSEPVQQTGTWLPDTAVTEGLRGSWVVYVAVPSGDQQASLEKRSITIHHAAMGQLYVSGALSADELIVTNGLHRVAPGQQVRFTMPSALSDARPSS